MHTLSEFSLKLLETDQDNLRKKLNWCCRASHEHQLSFLVLPPKNLTQRRQRQYHNCVTAQVSFGQSLVLWSEPWQLI